MSAKTEPMLFLNWMADQFDCGVPDPSVVSQCLAYVEGLRAADPERFTYLPMVVGQLRSFEVMLRQLKQYEVRMPHG